MNDARMTTSLIALAFAAFATRATAQDSAPPSCAECHNTDPESAAPPHVLLADSVHNTFECTDCHASIDVKHLDPTADKPHGESIIPVECGDCHEDQADLYEKHGRMEVGQDPDIPACWSCHGTHDILPSSDPSSRVHRANLPTTCRSCHTDVDLVKKHEILRDAPIRLYESSVHGRDGNIGPNVIAACNDCHSAAAPDGARTAHRILSPTDPESAIYHFNIPDTCGQCHKRVAREYWEGLHGQLVKRGDLDVPVCTHCHGEHGIVSPSDPRSPVSAAHVAEATCTPCHESLVLNEKYGIPAGVLRTYIDSYHGLKSKAGDVHVANCASCHGAHRILPHTDPTSSIHADNLQGTCGECHPSISTELANSPIHEAATGIKTGWPRFFTGLYLWLIGITIGLMLLHNGADWIRHVKRVQQEAFVVRLNPNETMQHWVLMVSFIVLVITGFALRFSEAWWVKLLFGWGGGAGFLIRGTIHRVAAVIFMIWAVWHALYLLTARGRCWFRDMLVSKRDLTNIKEAVLFFLGRRNEEPRCGRFSYMEKCEYWALIWGAVIMTATGILLWFDNYFVERWNLSKGILDVMLVIHYYEAWLASLAIFVWHIYGTVFRPTVYPMNPAWLTGRMPKAMYAHEHPEGPKLKAHNLRPGAEEEPPQSEPTTPT